MADLVLEPSSPLAGVLKPGRFGSQVQAEPGVHLSTPSTPMIFHIAAHTGQTAATATALGALLGSTVDDHARSVMSGDQSVIGIAPGAWLWLCNGAHADTKMRALLQASAETATSVDVTSAKSRIRISGPDARAALAKGCPIDLDAAVFQPGSAATTQIDQFVCQIWQVDDAPTYDILVARSLTVSFWSWITTSSAAFGYEVT